MTHKNRRVVLVRSNPVNPDSRLEKEAESLGRNEYHTSILAWGRWKTRGNIEKKTNYTIYRIPLRAPVGVTSVFFWPIWWVCEAAWLLFHKWDVVHVADFDCYLPALIVSKLKHKKIIYDIFDLYSETVMLPRIVKDIFSFIDLKSLNLADKIIIVDHCRLQQIKHDNDSEICVIYNTPNDQQILSKQMKKTDTFKIFYGGTISPDRDILSMIHVVEGVGGIQMLVAGGGLADETIKVQTACDSSLVANYIGRIPYEDILKYSLESDLLFALYDPAIPNNKLASPNKLFEAMMCGKPIIVNEGVATADKVREENCGLVVPYKDEEALREAVLYLKNNPDVCEELGRNGRRAYDSKYNWGIMEERLLNLYDSLLSESN